MASSESPEIYPPEKKPKISCDSSPSSSSSQPMVEKEEKVIVGSESDEEYETRYIKQVRASDGFDVDALPKNGPKYVPCGNIVALPNALNCPNTLKLLNELTDLAIRDYNEKNNANIKFGKVLKATSEVCRGCKYYITFEAEDATHDGQVKVFQALVWEGLKDTVPEVLLCRLKPTVQPKVIEVAED